MALPPQVTEVGGRILGGILRGGILAVGLLILGALIVGAILFVVYLRKFDMKVRLKIKRGVGSDGKPIYKIAYDRGGVFTRRAGKGGKIKVFRLLKERVELPEPDYSIINILSRGGNEVEIFKESDNEYYYSYPGQIRTGFRIKNGKPVEIERQDVTVVDPGVSFWNIQQRERHRKMFDTEGLLMKLLPFMIILLMIAGVIFYTYIWLDKAPAVVAAAQETSEALRDAAQALRDISIAQTATG